MFSKFLAGVLWTAIAFGIGCIGVWLKSYSGLWTFVGWSLIILGFGFAGDSILALIRLLPRVFFGGISGIQLLEASVTTKNGVEYFVDFRKLHPDCKPVEYIWLCLWLPQRLLYIIGNNINHSNDRKKMMDILQEVASLDLVECDSVAKELGLPITIQNGRSDGNTVTATIFYKNVAQRNFWTDIPRTWLPNQVPYTFVAVLDAVVPRLDDYHRLHLQQSLAHMVHLYDSGRDPATLAASIEVADLAFHAGGYPPE